MDDYYHTNFKGYYRKTVDIDPSFFLEPFAETVPENAVIIDVGCGSGRDLKWLKNRGFDPVGLDRSSGLVSLAGKNSGCRVIEADYETFDFSEITADAAVVSASLVHQPEEKLPFIIKRILKALTSPGYLYISLKEGRGTKTDSEGRFFCLWQDDDLRRVFSDLNLSVLHFNRSRSARGTGEVWLGYVLKKR